LAKIWGGEKKGKNSEILRGRKIKLLKGLKHRTGVSIFKKKEKAIQIEGATETQ